MSHLERVSLDHIWRSISVISAVTASPSLRVVVFNACSFSLQDIVNLLHGVPCLAVLHFQGLVSVKGLAERHDQSEEIVVCPLIDFSDADMQLQNGVSLGNREQGVSLEELRFTRLEVEGMGDCSALHLWDFLATSGVLHEVGVLDVIALDLYPVTPERLQTMVNLTTKQFAIDSVTFCGDHEQALNDREPIRPVLQLHQATIYQFSVHLNITRPQYDAYGLDEKLLLWNIQVLNTSHQLEILVMDFKLGSIWPPTNSNEADWMWTEVDKALTAARGLRVLLLVFQGEASDCLQDLRKAISAWILKRLPRAKTRFTLSEELGWHWNEGRRGCLKFFLSSDASHYL